MPIIRVRLVAVGKEAEALIDVLHRIEGVGRIDEVNAPMPRMGGERPGSSGWHAIEIDAHDHLFAERIRNFTAAIAQRLGATAEFVDYF